MSMLPCSKDLETRCWRIDTFATTTLKLGGWGVKHSVQYHDQTRLPLRTPPSAASLEIPDKIGKHNLQTALQWFKMLSFPNVPNGIACRLHTCKLERNTSKNIGHTEQKTNGESFLLTPSPAMPWRFALDLRHQAWPLKNIPAQSKRLVTKFFSCCEINSCPYLAYKACELSVTLTHGNWLLPKNRIIPNTCLRIHWRADSTLWWTAPFDASPPPCAPDVTAPHSFNMLLQQCAKEQKLFVISRKHSTTAGGTPCTQKLAQRRSEGPRNDPKWPPHHNASPLRAQNSHRATTRDRATIQNDLTPRRPRDDRATSSWPQRNFNVTGSRPPQGDHLEPTSRWPPRADLEVTSRWPPASLVFKVNHTGV